MLRARRFSMGQVCEELIQEGKSDVAHRSWHGEIQACIEWSNHIL